MRGTRGSALIADLSEEVERLVRVDPQRALALADRAVAAARGSGEMDAGIALRARAHALRLLSRYGEAVATYDAAIDCFERAGSRLEAARTAVGKIDAATNLGHLDAARAEASRARAVLAGHGDALAVAKLDLNIGIVAFQQDELQAALTSFRRAQRAFVLLGDDLHTAAAGANLGLVLTYLDRFSQARWHLTRARARYLRLGQPLLVAALDLNLGYVSSCQGEHLRALDHLLRARRDFERQGVWADLATTDLDIAQSYLALNMLPETVSVCREAAEIFEREGMTRDWARALVYQADASLETEPRAAIALLERARRVFAAASSRVWCALIDLRRAHPILSPANDEEGAAALAGAIATLAELGLERRVIEGRLIQAERAERIGDRSEALELCRAALAAAQRLAIAELRFRGVHALARMERSLPLYRAAAADLEAMRLALGTDVLRRALGGRAAAFYAELAALLTEQQAPPADVFQAMEAARARSLAEEPDGGKRRSAPPSDAGAEVTALREQVSALHLRLRAAELEGNAADVARLQRAAADREERLLACIRERGVALAARRARMERTPRQGQLATIDEIRARLQPGQALVEYLLLPEGLLALIIDGRGARAQRLDSVPEEISGLTAKLRFALNTCARRGEDWVRRQEEALARTARGYLHELYRRLMEPLALDAAQLVVVPAGPLHGIPFPALFDGSQYLLDRCELLVAPSATAWSRTRAPDGASGPALVMGAADEFAPMAASEAREIASRLRVRPYVGARATRAAFARRAPEVRLIHLAAHASVRADNPEFSAIHFEDGPLAAHEIASLRLRARIAILSACATGIGPTRGGEEIESLGHAFLAAGAQSLVVSLWPVWDRATRLMMAALHDALLRGASPPAALREAQRTLRETHIHPYYWAAFVAVGGWAAGD